MNYSDEMRARMRELNQVATAWAAAGGPKLPDDVDEHEAMLATWARAISGDYSRDELLDGVAAVVAASPDWPKVGHLVEAVRARRRDRLQRAGYPPHPDGLDQAAEREWAATWRAAVLRGSSRDAATALANSQLAVRPRPRRAVTRAEAGVQ